MTEFTQLAIEVQTAIANGDYTHQKYLQSQTIPLPLLLVSQSKGLHFSFVCHIISVPEKIKHTILW